jgi:hypothetical protein
MRRLRMLFFLIYVVAGLALYTTVGAQQQEGKLSGSMLRVGTFDSRALAMAYYRSVEFMQYMQELRAEHEKAKAAGDEKRVKELEVKGPAQQELIHKQGFSTWPVDNILEKIKGKIPEIAEQAEVDVIVCKWDIIYQRSGIEFIDVTDLMVKPFNPDEATLKIIKEIQMQYPVPLEELIEALKKGE